MTRTETWIPCGVAAGLRSRVYVRSAIVGGMTLSWTALLWIYSAVQNCHHRTRTVASASHCVDARTESESRSSDQLGGILRPATPT